MSAFVCGPDHFKALVAFATSRQPGYNTPRVDPRYLHHPTISAADREKLHALTDLELANHYADILYRENVRSVMGRYPDATRDHLPGPIDDTGHVTLKAVDLFRYRPPALVILKACACLEYQSCERDDWEQSLAFVLVQAIKEAAIRALPGYDDAPGWEYEAPVQPARRVRNTA